MGSTMRLLDPLRRIVEYASFDFSWLFSYYSFRICVSKLLFSLFSFSTDSLEFVSYSVNRSTINSSLPTLSSIEFELEFEGFR